MKKGLLIRTGAFFSIVTLNEPAGALFPNAQFLRNVVVGANVELLNVYLNASSLPNLHLVLKSRVNFRSKSSSKTTKLSVLSRSGRNIVPKFEFNAGRYVMIIEIAQRRQH